MAHGVELGWLAVATILVATACGSDDTGGGAAAGGGGTGGVAGQAGGGTGGQAGSGPTFGETDVAACVDTACAPQISSCKADPECPSYLACLDGCPLGDSGDVDPACAAACPVGSSSESSAAASAVNDCRTNGAGAICAACSAPLPAFTTPVLTQSCSASTESNVCWKCEDENCCESYVNCKSNAECQALKTCLGSCPDSDSGCEKGCVAQHPDGADDMGWLLGCMRVRCFADQPVCDRCKRPSDLECLYGTCGEAYAAFLSAPGGYAMEACLVACPIDDTVCDSACHSAYPDAYALYGPLASCVVTGCPTSP